MRTSILIAIAAVACACAPTGTGERFLTIGTDALATARALALEDGTPFKVLHDDGDVALIAVDASELDRLSQSIHAQLHRCGGFMLHDSLADAQLAPRVQRDNPAYTLDHAESVRAVLPQLDRERIVATIRELSAAHDRYYRSETGAAASGWLRDRWRSFTTRTDVTVELFDQGYPQKSVIMTIPGTTLADEVVVIGGHLDSISLRRDDSRAPGADDDASGIATLTEVARVLLASDFRPARTVKLMAYAAEEVGLRGSQAIVRDYRKRKVDVVGALQLDMTAYKGSDKDIWLIEDFTSPGQNAFLVKLLEAYVGATWGFDRCGYACSDHAAWFRAGVPASMPFEAQFHNYNRAIHTREDTLETSGGNADHAVKFARLAAAYAIELGKGQLGAPATAAAPAAPQDNSRSWLPLIAGIGALLGALWLAQRSVR